MSEKILSTANNERIWDAFHQVMERLKDPEALGMGVCYGYPGLGKTVTAEQIHAQMSESQTVDTYWVHAIKIWTPAAMLRDFAVATGFMPSRMNANDLLHELRERLLRRPGVFLIDEAHVFVTKGTLNELVKYLYDSTQCAFLFFGEPQTWKVIEGFVSFASRFNKNAIVEVQKYSLQEVTTVIKSRCPFEVDHAVCKRIYGMKDLSMRDVIEFCRQMKVYAMTNNLKKISLMHFNTMLANGMRDIKLTSQQYDIAVVGG